MSSWQDSVNLPAFNFDRITPEKLFANHTLINTKDLHRARASVGSVFFDHNLRTMGSRDLVNFTHRSVRLPSLSFNLISYGADVEVTAKQINRSHYVMVMSLSGDAEVFHQGSNATLDRGEFVILDPMGQFQFEMSRDHTHLAIGIPRERLFEHIRSLGMATGSSAVQFCHHPYRVSDVGNSLVDFLAYICQETDNANSLATRPVVGTAIEDSFLTLLVSSLIDANEIKISTGDDFQVPHFVVRAEVFLEENLMEEIEAQDIADAAGVPIRTLYHAFQKSRGLSPMASLRVRRLRQARYDLLHGDSCTVSVTEIAHRYQMPHMGRFASAFLKEFGEYPSDTLRRVARP